VNIFSTVGCEGVLQSEGRGVNDKFTVRRRASCTGHCVFVTIHMQLLGSDGDLGIVVLVTLASKGS